MAPLVGGAAKGLGASKGLMAGLDLGMRGLGAAGRAYEPPGTPNTTSSLFGSADMPSATQPLGIAGWFEKKIKKSLFKPYEDME